MGPSDFNFLPLSKRAAMVWDHGSLLSARRDGDYGIILYDMRRFYAEVWYKASARRIMVVLGFCNTSCLEPYLDQIALSDLS